MAGDLKGKYVASVTMTVTNLHSLASSQDWSAGWSSASVSNLSNLYVDYLISGTFTTHASNRQAGTINVFGIASLNDTPTWPATATGTMGTEGALSFTDLEERDCWVRPIASIIVDNSASAIVGFPPTSLIGAFGLWLPPTHWAIYVAQNAGTTTTAGLAAAGSAIYYTPILGQYT